MWKKIQNLTARRNVTMSVVPRAVTSDFKKAYSSSSNLKKFKAKCGESHLVIVISHDLIPQMTAPGWKTQATAEELTTRMSAAREVAGTQKSTAVVVWDGCSPVARAEVYRSTTSTSMPHRELCILWQLPEEKKAPVHEAKKQRIEKTVSRDNVSTALYYMGHFKS